MQLPRPYAKSSWSALEGLAYLNTEDPGDWPNVYMAKYYGVDKVIGIVSDGTNFYPLLKGWRQRMTERRVPMKKFNIIPDYFAVSLSCGAALSALADEGRIRSSGDCRDRAARACAHGDIGTDTDPDAIPLPCPDAGADSLPPAAGLHRGKLQSGERHGLRLCGPAGGGS